MDCSTEKEKKALMSRLNKIEGQVKGIKNMVLTDKSCMDVLCQVLSASSALKAVYQIISATHLERCINELDIKERKIVINEIITNLQKMR